MTATDIVATLRALGADVEIVGEHLEVVGRSLVPDAFMEVVRERSRDLRAILVEHQPAPATSTDALLAAASLLRSGKWRTLEPPCDFFIGSASSDKRCRRCLGPWNRHHSCRSRSK